MCPVQRGLLRSRAHAGRAGDPPKKGKVGSTISVSTPSKKAPTVNGYVTLTELSTTSLEAYFANGPCRLTVVVGPEGSDPVELQFDLVRTEDEKVGMLK